MEPFNLQLPVPLHVDHREHPWLCEEFKRLGATIGTYAVDYVWKSPYGLAVVQRKSLVDARNSIQDGTFSPEVLVALRQAATWVFVLLELDNGKLDFTMHDTMVDAHGMPTGFRLSSLTNYLTTLQRYGALLHISPDLSMTPATIVALMEYTMSRFHTAIYRPKVVDKEVAKTFATLLSIPGVDAVKTRGMARRFSTLREIANASVEDLAQTTGVGKITATKIYQHFREPLMKDDTK